MRESAVRMRTCWLRWKCLFTVVGLWLTGLLCVHLYISSQTTSLPKRHGPALLDPTGTIVLPQEEELFEKEQEVDKEPAAKVEENGLEQVKHVADKLDDQEDQRQRDEDEDGDERDGDRAAVVEEEGETEQRDVPLKQQPKNKLTGDSVVVASQAKRKVASHVMASPASVPKRNQSLKFVKGNTGRSYRERKRKGQHWIPKYKSERLQFHCNPPYQPVHGEEGDVPDGYDLLAVHAVIRHGDRSPMWSLPNVPRVNLSCETILSQLPKHPKLPSFVKTMSQTWKQHGMHPSIRRFGLFPRSKKCEGAQLTSLGVVQHLLNGEFLHKKYIEKWGLLDDAFETGSVLVHHTEYQRTFQSAMALLYGFLPVFDFTTLHLIHFWNIQFCSEKSSIPCVNKCNLAQRLLGVVSKENSARDKNSKLFQEVKAKLSTILNVQKKRLPWAASIMDVLMGFICHDKPLPCQRRRCITPDIVDDVWRHLDANGQAQVQSYQNQKLQRLVMNPMLQEMAARMDDIAKGLSKVKFALYSGHDTSVTPLAIALGIHDGTWPPYASRIILELYKQRNVPSGGYFLRVLYNGQDRTHLVRFCVGKMVNQFCPLENFIRYVNKDIFQNYFKVNSYADACKSKSR